MGFGLLSIWLLRKREKVMKLKKFLILGIWVLAYFVFS
jgi:hypothetical protein